jgi:hypothetical protein
VAGTAEAVMAARNVLAGRDAATQRVS